MAGIKRSINGQAKPQPQVQQPDDVAMPDATPPCGQPQPPSSKTTSSDSTAKTRDNPPKPMPPPKKPSPTSAPPRQPSHSHSKNPTPRQKLPKLPKLPKNTTITTRPLLHAPLPSPFSSSTSAKILYITATTPYIPALKRVRKLLNEVLKREKQSAASLSKARGGRGRNGGQHAQANGRLEARDVEAGIVGEMSRAAGSSGNSTGGKAGIGGVGAGKAGEPVYLKATGRAIPRALEIGVHFQAEEDCWVRVEMASVSAIDDVEVVRRTAMGEGGDEAEAEADDVPETRIRMLSSVTVSIGLK